MKRAWGWLPLSGFGALALSATLALLYFVARPQQDLVLMTLGLCYLALQLLMSTLVLLRGLVLWFQVRGARYSLPDGAEAERPYHLASPIALWNGIPFVQVRWTWTSPQLEVELVRREGRWFEQVTLPRRGDYQEVTRRYTVSDLLGLARIHFERRVQGDFRVVPGLGRISQQSLLVRWSSGEDISDPRGEAVGDRVDIRQYTRGDSPRTILWKVFARTRRLMVKVPERALAPRPKMCAYMVTGPEDEAAAALCRAMLEGNLLGPDWRFGCDGAPGQDHHKDAALERLCRSAAARSPQPDHLEEYLSKAERDGYAQGIVVLPLDLAGQDLDVRDRIQRSRMPVSLCLAVDGPGLPKGGRSLWSRWLRSRPESDRLQDQLRAAARLWQNFPQPIMVVDRQSGALLGDLQAFVKRQS